jgi:DNA-binding NtrC family response regulator
VEQESNFHTEGMEMKQKITVLIVEDNPDDYLILQEVLKSSNEVEAFLIYESRLEGALSAAGNENNAIDVAIVDLSLPDSFGLDTFVAFHERYPMIPTIIMTGARDQEMAFEAVRKGAQDYLFKSELTSAAIIRSIRYAIERQHLTTDLRTALIHIKKLQGMLPICAICKNIRDDKGYWNSVEEYISKHLDVEFSHGICPECAQKHYPEFYKSKN